MPRPPGDRASTRSTARLSRDGIVAAGIRLADAEGLESVSMRRLAQALGVDAMSLYHHVKDKDALLRAMVDTVVAEITPEDLDGATPWTARLQALVLAARRTMLRHPWAVRVLERRPPASPAVLTHVECVLAILRGGGCSVDLSHHALHLLGSRLLGFSQELFDDSPPEGVDPAMMAMQLRAWASTHPHVAELALAATHDGALGPCDDDAEFAFALHLMLQGLEQRRVAEATPE